MVEPGKRSDRSRFAHRALQQHRCPQQQSQQQASTQVAAAGRSHRRSSKQQPAAASTAASSKQQHYHSTYFPTTRSHRQSRAVISNCCSSGSISRSYCTIYKHACSNQPTCKVILYTTKQMPDAISRIMQIIAITNIPPATERPPSLRESSGGRQSTRF